MKQVKIDFPKRPLAMDGLILKRLKQGQRFGVFCMIFGAFLALLPAYLYGPDIMKDIKIKKDFSIINNATSAGGSCKVRKFFVYTCTSNFTFYDETNKLQTFSQSTRFVDLDFQPRVPQLLRSKSDSRLITTNLAIDKLYNRVKIALVLSLPGFAAIIGAFVALRRNLALYKGALKLNGSILLPVEIKIVKDISKNTIRKIIYQRNMLGKSPLYSSLFFETKEAPFLLKETDEHGHPLALGVTNAENSYVLILDEALTRLNLRVRLETLSMI